MSARTFTERPASPRLGTEGRSWSPRRPHRSSTADVLRDLGEHRLKDLAAPERIYQLGDEAFPPPRSLQQTNLPIPATPFLGRQRELDEVTALLGSEDARLLTLTGPAGAGKTRLALQAAAEASDHYPDGVFWAH